MSVGARRARDRLAWVGLAIVVGVTLAVGAWHGSSTPTAAQRAAAIDAAVKCPSCQGISVADSSAATAVAIRRAVADRVRAGQSDARIEQYLVSRFGPGILLRPPLHGATTWVWVLPPVALTGGLAGILVVAWRRRHAPGVFVGDDDRALVAGALAADARTRAPGPRLDELGDGSRADRAGSVVP
jgi:cytochrome c-type biogenesis protein CcmH